MNTNHIFSLWHCKRCHQELLAGADPEQSPRDYARFSVGWTEVGFQVWRTRHEMSVGEIDLLGNKVGLR